MEYSFRTFETISTSAAPSKNITLFVTNSNDGVIECRVNVGDTASKGTFDFLLRIVVLAIILYSSLYLGAIFLLAMVLRGPLQYEHWSLFFDRELVSLFYGERHDSTNFG